MQLAQKHEARSEQQPAQRQGSGNTLASPRGSDIAQLEALAANSPRMAAQSAIAAQLAASPAMAAQGQRMGAIKDSARMAIQQKRASEPGEAVQRVEEEEPMQGKFAPAQLEADDEEALQGKFAPAQLEAEDEEALQGKFAPAQLEAEDEEALQGKFAPAQLEADDEEALQGKFEPAQLEADDEEALQGKFEPAQLEADDEEALQGKFEPAQLEAEDEEPLQGKFEGAQLAEEEEPLQGKAVGAAVAQREAAGENKTGLPNQLKSGIESMSGMAMDHVKVHYNSAEPAQLNAHAFAQGSDIHVAPGQEQHLPHEAWHVVQQAQGRVQATTQMKTGTPVNDDVGLETEADVMGAKAMDTGKQVQAQAQLKEIEGNSTTAQLEDKVDATTTSEAAPSEAVVEEVKAKTQESGSVTTPGGLAVSASATPEEKLTLARVGDGLTTGVNSAGNVAAGIEGVASSIEKVANPLEKGSELFASTNSVWGHIKDAAVGVVGALASPIAAMITAGLGMKTKWAQWNLFDEMVMETKPNGKKGKKSDAPPEAAYALTKSPAGFMKHVKDMFMGVFNFTRNLLALIPGAQIVAGPMAVFSAIVGLMDSLYKAGKTIYQSIFGEKKDTHSASLLDKALAGNPKALQLILRLSLPSIAGSGFSFLDQVSAKLHTLTPRNVAAKVGLPVERTQRIIDLMKPGGGGPTTIEQLKDMLVLISGSAASKEVIRNEIKTTMTGYGR